MKHELVVIWRMEKGVYDFKPILCPAALRPNLKNRIVEARNQRKNQTEWSYSSKQELGHEALWTSLKILY